MAKTNPKKWFVFDKRFGKKAAEHIKGWIKRDMLAGILQGGTGKGLSKGYKKYKANWMKRFTDRSGPGTKGSNLISLKGASAKSNYVGGSNMYLTGHLIDSHHYDSNTKTAIVLAYGGGKQDEGEAADKLINNERLGRHIRTLREENQKKFKKLIVKQFDKNIKKNLKKNVVVNIGKK